MKFLWWMALLSRVARDLLLGAVGYLGLSHTPPSLNEFGVDGPLGVIWGAMLLGGAAASLYGTLRRNISAEIYGCAMVGAGFVVWAYAALSQPDITVTTWMTALVFLSGTAGQFYRVAMAAMRGK